MAEAAAAERPASGSSMVRGRWERVRRAPREPHGGAAVEAAAVEVAAAEEAAAAEVEVVAEAEAEAEVEAGDSGGGEDGGGEGGQDGGEGDGLWQEDLAAAAAE